MRRDPPPELFTPLSSSALFQITEEEGRDAVVRARNAALQMPLNHLEAQRAKLREGEVEFFREINPIQVAQQFLAIVGNSMLDDGIEHDDAARTLASFIERLAVSQPLSREHAETAAWKVIEIIRNRHSDSEKFTEFYHDPYTGARESIEFQLVQSNVRTDGTAVYKLTPSGVKLLFLNWSQSDDFNMTNLLIEQSIKSGQYRKSIRQLDLAKNRAIMIAARLSEIQGEMRRLSYDKDFGSEIKGLLDDRKEEVDEYKASHQHFQSIFKSAREAHSGDAEDLAAISALEDKLEEIWTQVGRLTAISRAVLREYGELQDRLIFEVGNPIKVPDIQGEVVRRIITASDADLDAATFGDTCFNTLFPARMKRHLDPFAILDRLRIEDVVPDEVEEHELVEIKRDMTAYRPAEQIGAQRQLQNLLISAPNGLSLSQITESVLTDDKVGARMKQCILHRAVLFTASDGWRVIKTPLPDWLDNQYFESRNFVMKLERAPKKESKAA